MLIIIMAFIKIIYIKAATQITIAKQRGFFYATLLECEQRHC